jgi:SAM-dependent methyltransferase
MVQMTDPRYAREQEFHDRTGGDRWQAVEKYYAVTQSSHAEYHARIVAAARGAHVLEYGCGDGSSAFLLAENGARVTGIDISPERIRRAAAEADARRMQNVDFRVMNAEHLEFEDNAFDLICGTSIIHHLDLDRSTAELARTLKPSGRAVFLEPLGHNPVINAYRRRTPAYRTHDEHPLLMRDLESLGRRFDVVDARFFHLVSLAAYPFRSQRGFNKILRGLEHVDRAVFALAPMLRRYAWVVVLSLAQPHSRASAVMTDS